MDAIEKRARELLAGIASLPLRASDDEVIALIAAALTPPEGYVLVPVEPTPEMELAIVDWLEGRSHTGDCYEAILAARPEVP